MKNSMRRAMISTVCMLIVAVMSLTGVTYAWFTAGADATINNVTVDVVAADGGIQFSRNGTDWMSQVSSTVAGTFVPVSTVGALDDNREIKFFSGAVNPAMMSEIKTTATTAGYYAEELYVRNVSGSQITVQLQDISIPDDALAALKENEYVAVKSEALAVGALALFGIKDVDAVVSGSATIDEKFETVTILYFKDKDAANNAWENAQKYADGEKNDKAEDWVVKKSGAMIYFGTPNAVKAAK